MKSNRWRFQPGDRVTHWTRMTGAAENRGLSKTGVVVSVEDDSFAGDLDPVYNVKWPENKGTVPYRNHHALKPAETPVEEN